MAHRIEERTLLAGDQAVDQHEAGYLRIIEFNEVDAAGHRREAQGNRADENEDEAPPKDRHGIAGEGETHQSLIVDATTARGGDDAGRNADDRREDQRAEG